MWRKRTFSELAHESTERKGRLPLILVLHNIRSQYNVGAILRTADAVGVQKVILSGYTPQPEQGGVRKTALKGLGSVPCEYHPDIIASLRLFKSEQYTLYALEQCHGSVSYQQLNYQFPSVLILGEEVAGIEQDILDLCDVAVEIPMFGKAHSLNVSVAAGVMMYKFLEDYQL